MREQETQSPDHHLSSADLMPNLEQNIEGDTKTDALYDKTSSSSSSSTKENTKHSESDECNIIDKPVSLQKEKLKTTKTTTKTTTTTTTKNQETDEEKDESSEPQEKKKKRKPDVATTKNKEGETLSVDTIQKKIKLNLTQACRKERDKAHLLEFEMRNPQRALIIETAKKLTEPHSASSLSSNVSNQSVQSSLSSSSSRVSSFFSIPASSETLTTTSTTSASASASALKPKVPLITAAPQSSLSASSSDSFTYLAPSLSSSSVLDSKTKNKKTSPTHENTCTLNKAEKSHHIPTYIDTVDQLMIVQHMMWKSPFFELMRKHGYTGEMKEGGPLLQLLTTGQIYTTWSQECLENIKRCAGLAFTHVVDEALEDFTAKG